MTTPRNTTIIQLPRCSATPSTTAQDQHRAEGDTTTPGDTTPGARRPLLLDSPSPATPLPHVRDAQPRAMTPSNHHMAGSATGSPDLREVHRYMAQRQIDAINNMEDAPEFRRQLRREPHERFLLGSTGTTVMDYPYLPMRNDSRASTAGMLDRIGAECSNAGGDIPRRRGDPLEYVALKAQTVVVGKQVEKQSRACHKCGDAGHWGGDCPFTTPCPNKLKPIGVEKYTRECREEWLMNKMRLPALQQQRVSYWLQAGSQTDSVMLAEAAAQTEEEAPPAPPAQINQVDVDEDSCDSTWDVTSVGSREPVTINPQQRQQQQHQQPQHQATVPRVVVYPPPTGRPLSFSNDGSVESTPSRKRSRGSSVADVADNVDWGTLTLPDLQREYIAANSRAAALKHYMQRRKVEDAEQRKQKERDEKIAEMRKKHEEERAALDRKFEENMRKLM